MTQTGLYKIDENGNISTVGLFVNEDGIETQSSISVVPDMLINATEDFMIFYSCHYLDKDGDEISRDTSLLPNRLFIHKADGRIYNADNLPWYIGPEATYLGDGPNNMYGCGDNHIVKISIDGDECTWQQITPDNSPINISWDPKLFKMNSGAVAAVSPVPSIYSPGWNLSSLAIIYPQGGYDWFTGHSPYIALSDGFIESISPAKYVSVGSAYGQLTETTLSGDSYPNEATTAYSWCDMGDKALIKAGLGNSGESIPYYLFDRTAKTLTRTDIDFGGLDLIELWNENLYNQRFYGLVGSNNHYTKIAWINPETLDYGTIDLNLANEIDVTSIVPDYSHGKMQMTGTRRSDGYNVAIDLDLTTGRYTTMFSDPNRQITALIPLN